jgi:glycosidase
LPLLKLNLTRFQNSRQTNWLAGAPKEFHVSRKARDSYQFDESLFASSGNLVLANFHAARVFAQRMNEKRDVFTQPEQTVRAGEINAMGLIDEIQHAVIALYRQQISPGVFQEALDWLGSKVGAERVESTLIKFVEEFPPMEVYKNKVDIHTYLTNSTSGTPNRQIVLEEMLLLWLANLNPAFAPFLELFDDEILEKQTAYLDMMQSLRDFFATKPKFGPSKQNLVDLLRTPALRHPHSLQDQLSFIREHWGLLIQHLLYRLLISFDFLKEEFKPVFFGPPPTAVPVFGGKEHEPEQFSPDLDWMPRLVLIAKSTLVWLDQLSKKYQRAITRLDQIPDEELDMFARWGFTGLWLIGVWERSPASKKIKQLCGNPEAESSAYSLFDYQIAYELGGHEALQNLKNRCWRRGLRLACDMVPNHTGIDSKWVREHPDWFISLPYSPFPAYSFNGPNLSSDPRYGIFIDDKYYSREDAAVVFKRQDYWTGDVRYIYHGNDGTHTPWNDTAQLNYLNPDVREAAIQTILHVARMFSVIRFDAAMTLTKRHYQRLWFPEPGSGGDIPSRAGQGLTKTDLNRAMPNEFWREVVDRVAQEASNTLLLAEAFWLMEGYFVRSLGMHRVYNSAFMNMLKREENQKYRDTIKNTIQFNPEILKRYVNFMNNPDEDTAVAQFGKGDKYFGVCTMMVTMPGLPMFGHGQIEGFSEKYGMEYRRAYWDEQVDWGLVHRHEREIFPLMKKRYLFAAVDNFLLYDFFTPGGQVDENVFAYSNRFGDERALVIYNNRYGDTRGWIRYSTAFAVKTGVGDETRLVQQNLGQGLAIYHNEDYFCVFRDHVTGLEYLRNCKEMCERGLYVELGAYKYQVFLDFRQVKDNEWRHYAQLTASLRGRGVPSIDEALHELYLGPLLQAFDALVNPEMLRKFTAARLTKMNKKLDQAFLSEFEEKYLELLRQAKHFSNGRGEEKPIGQEVLRKLAAVLSLETVARRFPLSKSKGYSAALAYLKEQLSDEAANWRVLYGWLIVHDLGKIVIDMNYEEQSRSWLDEWLLGKRIHRLLEELGDHSLENTLLVGLLTSQQNWHRVKPSEDQRERDTLDVLFKSPDVQQFLKVNRFNDILWFNKENFEKLASWLYLIAAVQITAQPKVAKDKIAREILSVYETVRKWLRAEKLSEYQVEKLLDGIKGKKDSVKLNMRKLKTRVSKTKKKEKREKVIVSN